MRFSLINLPFLTFVFFIFQYSYCFSEEIKSISTPQINNGVSININVSEMKDSPEDIKAKEYFDRIKEAVKNNDYVWLANQIGYPVCLNDQVNDEKENLEFKTRIFSNAKELLEHKEEFFNQDFKDAILSQDRNGIYSNYLGYVIGYGALHFDIGVIYATNSENSLLKNCTSDTSHQRQKKPPLHSYSDLNGDWQITDYSLNGVSENDADDIAKANMLKIANVHSNVLSLKLVKVNINCHILENPKLMRSEDFYFWDPSIWGSSGGGLRSNDFNFSDKIYVYKTDSRKESYDLKEIVVDIQKQKLSRRQLN